MSELSNRIIKILNEYSEQELDQYIDSNPDPELVYHLSSLRKGLVEWYPFNSNENVLEIGGKCATLTEPLSRLCKHVTVLEDNLDFCEVIRTRLHKQSNVNVISSLKECEHDQAKKYDHIFLLVDFQEQYIQNNHIIAELKELLSNNGKIWIAVQNKLGLKYLAGCQEEANNLFFKNDSGFSKSQIEKIVRENGLKCNFYYPYPDMFYPMSIYSDLHLPLNGELNNNYVNLSSKRYVTFDETRVWNLLIDEELFAHFSNSFLCILE